MRVYKGTINDAEDREKYNLPEKALFVNNGFWVAGSREINSYIICNEDGDEIEELNNFQFSKDRHNNFYLEAIG